MASGARQIREWLGARRTLTLADASCPREFSLLAFVRTLALLFVVLMFGAGCGENGSSSANNAETQIDPDDEARAARITFQRSDFPIGWSVQAKDQGRFAAIPGCLKLRWSDLAPSGSSVSKIIEDDTASEPSAFETTYVASAVAIYSDEDQARIAFERASSDAFEQISMREKLAECFKAYTDNQVEDVSFQQLPAPRLIDEAAVHQVGKKLIGPSLTDDAAAYEVRMTLVDSGAPAWEDVLFLQKARSLAVLTFFHAYFDWDDYEEEPLANTVARRMGSHTGSLGSPATLPAASCGDLLSTSISAITGRGLSCVRARRIVRQFLSNCSEDPCLLTRSHFYCATRVASYRYSHIGCAYQPDLRKPIRSQRTVVFQTNE